MKAIAGYEGKYAITRDGRVWSFPKKGGRENGMFLKATITNPGYKYVRLSGRLARVHRILAEAFIPNPNNLPEVNHIDGDKLNNNIKNLEWVSHKENMLHAAKMGFLSHPGEMGEKCVTSILKNHEVIEIRRLRKETKMTLHQLGERFSVSFRTIWDVTSNRRWQHLL